MRGLLRFLVRQDWLLAVALSVFVAVTVWFARAVEDFIVPTTPQFVAPTLVGQTEKDAIDEAQRLHLAAVVVERETSDTYAKDVVMRQEPVPGTPIREGRRLSLVVSDGVQILPMPDVRYETLREVGLEFSHAKLQLGKVRMIPDDDVPANAVVAQNPLPLTSVRIGTVVDLDVSKGPPSALRVPKFVGLTIDQARDLAKQSKIHLGQIVWTPFGPYGPPHGQIVRQDPGPDARIGAFDNVSLQVSAGPRESGYLIRQFHAAVSVPEGHQQQLVRLQIHDETGTWNAYEAYAQPHQKLEFTLSVIGTAELDVYVNNELLKATKLGVEPPLPPISPDQLELQREQQEYGTPEVEGTP